MDAKHAFSFGRSLQIADLIGADGVIPALHAADKTAVLAALSAEAAGALSVEASLIFQALVARERIGATGVGRGVAIPHARVPGLRRLFGLLARLDFPVDFGAPDDEPVDLVFLLLCPLDENKDYLTALAGVSRVLGNRCTAERLRLEQDRARILDILTGPDSRALRACRASRA
jgi:PTS system nitrogen regulatory IIA component